MHKHVVYAKTINIFDGEGIRKEKLDDTVKNITVKYVKTEDINSCNAIMVIRDNNKIIDIKSDTLNFDSKNEQTLSYDVDFSKISFDESGVDICIYFMSETLSPLGDKVIVDENTNLSESIDFMSYYYGIYSAYGVIEGNDMFMACINVSPNDLEFDRAPKGCVMFYEYETNKCKSIKCTLTDYSPYVGNRGTMYYKTNGEEYEAFKFVSDSNALKINSYQIDDYDEFENKIISYRENDSSNESISVSFSCDYISVNNVLTSVYDVDFGRGNDELFTEFKLYDYDDDGIYDFVNMFAYIEKIVDTIYKDDDGYDSVKTVDGLWIYTDINTRIHCVDKFGNPMEMSDIKPGNVLLIAP